MTSFGGVGVSQSSIPSANTTLPLPPSVTSYLLPLPGSDSGCAGVSSSFMSKMTTSAGLGFCATSAMSSVPTVTFAAGLTGVSASQLSTTASRPASSGATSNTLSGVVTGDRSTAMSYRQLEELINKWSLELEQQETTFLDQATQVNGWDRVLLDNGDKITQLHADVECLKVNQARLDQEIDYIVGQQQELIDVLIPVENALDQLTVISHQQRADIEREHIYKLSENIDSQLKQMAADLKDIVERLNRSSKTQDFSDPLNQIAKILSRHVDVLQWIDRNTGCLQQRIDSVAKLVESRRKQQISHHGLHLN